MSALATACLGDQTAITACIDIAAAARIWPRRRIRERDAAGDHRTSGRRHRPIERRRLRTGDPVAGKTSLAEIGLIIHVVANGADRRLPLDETMAYPNRILDDLTSPGRRSQPTRADGPHLPVPV